MVNKKTKFSKQVETIIREDINVSIFEDEITFLLFMVKYKTQSYLKYLIDVKGINNLNTDLFKQAYKEINKGISGDISPSYKLVLMKYFTENGLNNFIIKSVEEELIEFMKENNMLLK